MGSFAARSTSTDAFAAAHSFFQSTGWLLFRNLAIAFLVSFWVASVFWIFRDARRRISDPWLVVLATVVGAIPVVGPVFYLLLRPLEIIVETRERELEIRALRQRIRGGLYCPACGADSDASFRFCPVCATEIKKPCVTCETALEPLWQVCPYCGTPATAPSLHLLEGAPSFTEILETAASEPVSH